MKEALRQGDIVKNVRVFLKIDRIPAADIVNITGAIQGVFDYI